MIYLEDRCVIDRFVAHLKKNGYPGIKVDQYPEDQNRSSPEIDAIAGPFAIEHTRIDTLPDQSRKSYMFGQVVDGLEEELSSLMSFRLKITLEYDAVTTKQNWKAINQTLRNWVIKESSYLEDGHYVLDNVPDIPFPLDVVKDSYRRPKLVFYRFSPNDKTLPARIKRLCDKKAAKLAKYQALEKTTLLLIESNDIAHMHSSIMRQEIRKAYPNGLPPGVDKIWYADTADVRDIPFEDEDITFEDFTLDLLSPSRISRRQTLFGRR